MHGMSSDKPKNKICIFKGVSSCSDHVSAYLCNSHANLFGLQYELASYCNGNNDVWSKIVTYVTATNTLNLPLFLDSNSKILVNEIRTFALTTCNNFPNINIEKFQEVISCYLGLSPFQDNCPIGGWLDNEKSNIICNENDNVQFVSHLPRLHKILFQYSIPSIIINSSDQQQICSIPNVWLVYNQTNNSYYFTLINKEILLKRTDREHNVATPLVIMAKCERSFANADKTFLPVQTIEACF